MTDCGAQGKTGSGCLFVHREQHGHEISLVLRGSLDPLGVTTLERVLDHLALADSDHVVLDLEQLDSVDAGGARVIRALRERCVTTHACLDVLAGPAALDL